MAVTKVAKKGGYNFLSGSLWLRGGRGSRRSRFERNAGRWGEPVGLPGHEAPPPWGGHSPWPGQVAR